MKESKTKLGKFLKKAALVVPGIVAIAGELKDGDIIGAIQKAKTILAIEAPNNKEVRNLLSELDLCQMDFLLDEMKLANEDKASAREREIAYLRAGKYDFMQTFTGTAGLGAFCFLVYSMVFIEVPDSNREVFFHLIGMVEGVVITMFSYFYGPGKLLRNR